MKIDLEHLHYWMCAIRESKDPFRTLDAFWKGQLKSKEWLIESLIPFINYPVTIDIHGGWVGLLASLLFQSNLKIKSIRSIDIDPNCESISIMMNKKEEMEGRFTALTENMCNVQTYADIVINTSCEHLTQFQYNLWVSNIKKGTIIIIQSNNYKIPEHVRPVNTLEEFKEQSNINVLWAGELNLPLYKRFMIIGH